MAEQLTLRRPSVTDAAWRLRVRAWSWGDPLYGVANTQRDWRVDYISWV